MGDIPVVAVLAAGLHTVREESIALGARNFCCARAEFLGITQGKSFFRVTEEFSGFLRSLELFLLLELLLIQSSLLLLLLVNKLGSHKPRLLILGVLVLLSDCHFEVIRVVG